MGVCRLVCAAERMRVHWWCHFVLRLPHIGIAQQSMRAHLGIHGIQDFRALSYEKKSTSHVLMTMIQSFVIVFSPPTPRIADIILGLRDVHIRVPLYTRNGDDALLMCNYNLENDTLYSIKWYRGRREFYRYLPKENPAIKLFPVSGITVEVSVFLPNVTLFYRQSNVTCGLPITITTLQLRMVFHAPCVSIILIF